MKEALTSIVVIICCCMCYCAGTQQSNVSVHCVIPHQNPSRRGCRTLEDYAQDTEASLSNSVLMFDPGIHTLNRSWTLYNTSNLVIKTAEERDSVIINCTARVGLYFENVSELTINGIEIAHCSTSENLFKDIVTTSSLILHNGKNLQIKNLNVTESSGGGIAIVDVTGEVVINHSFFTNAMIPSKNMTRSGNIIAYNTPGEKAIVNLLDTVFENNHYVVDKVCQTKDTKLSAGLAVIIRRGNVSINVSGITLEGNHGCAGGNMAIIFFDMYGLINSTSISIGSSVIKKGLGSVGGGVFVTMVNSDMPFMKNFTTYVQNRYVLPILQITDTKFEQNNGVFAGGALYVKQLETYHFSYPGIVKITECQFKGNTGSGGLAVHFITFIIREYKPHNRPQVKVHISNCTFAQHYVNATNVTAHHDTRSAVIFVKTSPLVRLHDITIANNSCTGLLGITSNFVISGNVSISNNTAFKGGGILLCSGAVLFFTKNTTMSITKNVANYTGGGILIEDECTINRPQCFFQLNSDDETNTAMFKTIEVIVKDNRGHFSGDNIYGGSIGNCYMINTSHESENVFEKIFNVESNSISQHNSSIASAPERVCVIKRNTYCDNVDIKLYPGQTRLIKVVITGQTIGHGQKPGLVPGTVSASLDESVSGIVFLDKKNHLQKVPSTRAETLKYRIYSKQENITATLYLTVEGVDMTSQNAHRLKIHIHIKACPLGYQLLKQSTQSRCACALLRQYLPKNVFRCMISRQVGISYSPPMWIGKVMSHNQEMFAVTRTCPQDYCNSSQLFLRLTNLSVESTTQCSFGRVGVMCGHCQNGSSVILGSSRCESHCTNYFIFFLVVFAFAGVLLVFFLSFLNLTVTVGTINGIVFYANIIQIYNFFLFEENDGRFAAFFRIFIAWLNLDFGFQVCFFRGMDAFAKALLQFSFPLYIWTIAGVIIILSKHSSTIATLLGRNSVQLLATLVLLSYSKIIRAAMDALHFTRLFLPVAGKRSFRWTIDGNLKYLEGKHVVVFAVGAIFAMASLPFMVILLCVQHTGRVSHWRIFSWIHRLKPFFDSYTGPFRDRARFWVGLLLFARLFILGIHSFNIADSDVIIMAAVLCTCLSLLFISLSLPRGIYKHHWLNVLENFFIIKLGALFLGLICSIYYKSARSRVYFVNATNTTTFLVFVLIVGYHVMYKTRCLPKIRRALSRRRNMHKTHVDFESEDNCNQLDFPPYKGFNEDREPLLADSSQDW